MTENHSTSDTESGPKK